MLPAKDTDPEHEGIEVVDRTTVTELSQIFSEFNQVQAVADRVVVMRGNDRDKMRELLSGQDVVLVTVAGGMVEKDGKFMMVLDTSILLKDWFLNHVLTVDMLYVPVVKEQKDNS